MKQLFTHGYRLYLCLLACLLLGIGGVQGQAFTATYNFSSVTSGLNGRVDPTPVPTVSNLTFGSFTAVPASGNPHTLGDNPNAGGRFSFAGWPTGATNGSDVFTGAIDLGQYYEVSVTPTAGFTLDITSITFTLQRSGTGIRQYAVRSSLDGYAANLPAAISPTNANLQVVTGNIFQVTDPTTNAQDGSRINLSNHTAINSTITFRFYAWNAEGAGGTFSIDNVVLSGSVNVVGGATLSANPTSLSAFGNVDNGSFSSVQEYTLTASNLSADVVITAPANFQVSKTSTGGFASSITYTVAEFGASQTVFARFAPASGLNGTKSGNITNVSGTASTNVAVSGTETGTQELIESFEAACPSLGTWRQISVIGDGQTWQCSTNGRVGNAARMSGFAGSPQDNEDWLISPALNITAASRLSFFSWKNFTGPDITLRVSTNYNGTGNPNNATWTTVSTSFATTNQVWTATELVNLSAFAGSNVYIAFVYTSNPTDNAAEWRIDDITISNATVSGPTLSANPTNLAAFANTNNGAFSAVQEYVLSGTNINADVVITAPANFQVSKTSTEGFSSSITYTAAEFGTSKTVFVRFAPNSGTNGLKSGNITNVSGAASANVAVSGTEIGNTIAALPLPYTENFETACPPANWTITSVVGAQQWNCVNFGFNNSRGLRMSGFASGNNNQNEDWAILPLLALTPNSRLSFKVERRFDGEAPTIRISSNYAGVGNPNDATWTTLSGNIFPAPAATNDVWVNVENINPNISSNGNFYIAFVYTSTTAAATRITLDDIEVRNVEINNPPTSISDELSARVQIYPNPSQGIVNITNLQGEFEVEVVNLLGQSVRSSKATNEVQLNLASLEKGLYVVKVKQNNQIGVKRLVVE